METRQTLSNIPELLSILNKNGIPIFNEVRDRLNHILQLTNSDQRFKLSQSVSRDHMDGPFTDLRNAQPLEASSEGTMEIEEKLTHLTRMNLLQYETKMSDGNAVFFIITHVNHPNFLETVSSPNFQFPTKYVISEDIQIDNYKYRVGYKKVYLKGDVNKDINPKEEEQSEIPSDTQTQDHVYMYVVQSLKKLSVNEKIELPNQTTPTSITDKDELLNVSKLVAQGDFETTSTELKKLLNAFCELPEGMSFEVCRHSSDAVYPIDLRCVISVQFFNYENIISRFEGLTANEKLLWETKKQNQSITLIVKQMNPSALSLRLNKIKHFCKDNIYMKPAEKAQMVFKKHPDKILNTVTINDGSKSSAYPYPHLRTQFYTHSEFLRVKSILSTLVENKALTYTSRPETVTATKPQAQTHIRADYQRVYVNGNSNGIFSPPTRAKGEVRHQLVLVNLEPEIIAETLEKMLAKAHGAKKMRT